MSGLLSAHNYLHLVRRWRKVARRCGLDLEAFAKAGDYPVIALRSRRPPADAPSAYLSAGIHGDEAAATEGLVTWAERHPDELSRIDATIFPCLNPWGLVNNNRLDHKGRDLNRCYNLRRPTVIASQIRLLKSRRFDFAITLHEDYDAHGIYVYEVSCRRPFWAERLLEAASEFVPVDPRRTIEGRRARAGIVRRKLTPDLMPDWPEAFLLHFHHADRTFTVETPSEFHIAQRVAAQIAVLRKAVQLGIESDSHFPFNPRPIRAKTPLV